MHIDHLYPTQYYTDDNGITRQLQTITEEKDLGNYVTSDLKQADRVLKHLRRQEFSKNHIITARLQDSVQ